MARLKKKKFAVREKSELDRQAEIYMIDHGFDHLSLDQLAELFDYELPSAKPLASPAPQKEDKNPK